MTPPPMKRIPFSVAAFALLIVAPLLTSVALASPPPDGWETKSPRDEIRPEFSFDATGGPDGTGSFAIESGARDELAGLWSKTYQIKGGQWYRFTALRRAERVAAPRR